MLAPVGEGVGANWDARSPAPPPKSGGKRKGGGGNGGNNGTWSPRSCLLVRDFLVPCLDSGCYGDDLQWLNRRRGVFLIRWTHQGSKSFNREGPNVFRDWSILKRKWDEHDPNRLSKAKQRVRAAFRKLPNVRRINDGAAPHRIYRIKDIGVYLKPWKEPKEKKRKKKPRQPCGCAPGDPSCRHMPRGHSEQEQGAASSTGAEEDDDDDDYNYMEDGEEDCGEEDYEAPVDSKSAVSLSANGSVWSSLHSLTEEVSVSREVVAGEDHQDESSLSPSWGPADMEAVQALLSIRHGRPLPPMTAPTQAPPVAPPGGAGGTVALQSSQPTTALTTTASGMDATAAPRTEAKDQSTVSAELRVTSNGVAPPPADGEASLAPHSVHVFKELLAAALSSAPRPAQPATVTGDSPHMFWADAAPARHGEQPPQKQLHTMAAASVKGPCLQDFGIESEPVPSYEAAAKGTAVVPCSVATGAATHSGGWTDQPSAYSSSSSSWLDRNEPLRPDGCWTTR